MTEAPYLTKEHVVQARTYNPNYGDDRVCVCGHSYYRHFDSYEDMEPVGCKYCGCYEFVEHTGEYNRPSFFKDADVWLQEVRFAWHVENDESLYFAESLRKDGTYKYEIVDGPHVYEYQFQVCAEPKVLLDYENGVCTYTVNTSVSCDGVTKKFRLDWRNEQCYGIQEL